MLCTYKFVNTKSSLAFLLHPMDISYYAKRYLLKGSPVNRLAFVVCAKRGGFGDKGEKRDRKKGRDRLPSLPNPPLPFHFVSILYHFRRLL